MLRARERSLAGATVVRGLMGYGANSRLHTFKIERLSLDLPIVVEIVDTREKLEAFLAEIDPIIHDGLATLEEAEVRFRPHRWNRTRLNGGLLPLTDRLIP